VHFNITHCVGLVNVVQLNNRPPRIRIELMREQCFSDWRPLFDL
jgi:hypothetical protein